ncbi:type I restriction modification DNA specificity domain protein [Capnocytophaga sp. oral taxon 863 str. F0517]|uniref:restriction endonuclease subunit S n=1 Tax=Capnocytophaga sp. oral taxon 863 TaxID=1227265 RepID=UPI000396ACB2|nr:restriction endonuclease subunit S [Capnocytophaga sp. oral taxon 863]ERI63727.1 type I restriction modification DNA specificity domain protein [Capnocytophaga sp. oral taxon 863 str. F0517]
MITNIPKHWKIKKLGEIGIFFKGKGVPKNKITDTGFKCLTYGDLYTKYNFVIEGVKSFIDKETALISQEIRYGDICFAGSGETLEDIGKCATFIDDEIGYAGGDIIVFRTEQNPIVMSYLLNSDIAKKQKFSMGQGHSVVHIYSSQLEMLKLPLPPLKEQEKIAEILLTCDKAIRLTTQIITQLKQRNQGLAQQLLTGEKSNYKTIGKYIKEISNRNSNLQVKKVLSVTNSKGFINQFEQFGRELASSDVSNYKIVSKGQFAYNPSRVNVGSIDLLQDSEIGILSPMYIVFETKKDYLSSKFLYYHLKSNSFLVRIPTYVQGSVRDTLSFKALSEMEFFIPNIEKQKKITKILDTAHQELKLYEQKLQLLQAQKKTLMQKLLTGEVLTIK